jgi:DNA ligase-1
VEVGWYSRAEDLVTEKFPEFQALKNILPEGTVIDGEILPFRDDQPLSFNVLQTRIGRKNVTPKILKDAPVVFLSYDILEWKGEDIRHLPMSERRKMLADLVKEMNNPVLRLSPVVEFNDWDHLAVERKRSRELLSEGIMLKKLDSPYETGRKRGSWWKWKVDPLTIDAVLVYASRGSGRRANLYTDYTFAVWNDEGVLVPFTKAYSGLTDQEIREVDAFIKKNTLEKFGPVRSITPELVFEIAFEGIAASSRHKSGIALRFPRIMRWRKDKPAKEADTLATLREILKQYGSA